MHIAVIGATRGVGREVVGRALAAGHRVRACGRHIGTLEIRHPDLEIAQIDATHPEEMHAALRGCDAVVCALGAPALSKERIRTRGTHNLVRAMKSLSVRRLVCLTSLGFGDSRPLLPPVMRYVVVPLYLARAFEDHAAQEEVVRASTLEWTIVRPGNMKDGQFTGRYRTGFRFDDRSVELLPVSRADVADFLLRQVFAADAIRAAVGICGLSG